MFNLDHIAFSVKDIEKSIEFYNLFGFNVFKNWDAEDLSVRMVLLKNQENIFIELVCCRDSVALSEHSKDYIKDLQYVGIKHMSLRVKSVDETLEYLITKGIKKFSKTIDKSIVLKGKMGRKYFFINDPDGVILEFVEY